MPDPIVYGFPRSTYVNIVRLVLTHKNVPYSFHDLELINIGAAGRLTGLSGASAKCLFRA